MAHSIIDDEGFISFYGDVVHLHSPGFKATYLVAKRRVCGYCEGKQYLVVKHADGFSGFECCPTCLGVGYLK